MNKKETNKTSKTKLFSKEKIIEIAIQKLQELQNTNFLTAKILSDYSFFDIAKKIINTNLKESNYNNIDFILAISTYLSKNNTNLIKQNQLETHKTIIKETKHFYKHIKKSLKKIQNQFDNTYLLFSREKDTFFAIDNAKLIEALDELSHILNLTNNHKEAELAFDLKSKIELGFQRYFLHEKDSIILSQFNTTGEYTIATTIDIINIQTYFNMKLNLPINLQTNNFTEILTQLIYLKNNDKKEFETQLKNYKHIYEFFPEKIYKKEEYTKHHKLALSINKDFQEDTLQLQKEKLILISPYNINSFNLTLEILK